MYSIVLMQFIIIIIPSTSDFNGLNRGIVEINPDMAHSTK